jgi:hypothetical protein
MAICWAALCSTHSRGNAEYIVAGKRFGKHTLPWQRIWRLQQTNRSSVCSVCGPHRVIKGQVIHSQDWLPCGGGVEYLNRNPASRRRRRKGKSGIWDSKIWSRVPRGSDPRMTTLARASSNYTRKWQTRPFVRESASYQQTRNCLTVIKIWS